MHDAFKDARTCEFSKGRCGAVFCPVMAAPSPYLTIGLVVALFGFLQPVLLYIYDGSSDVRTAYVNYWIQRSGSTVSDVPGVLYTSDLHTF